MIALEDALKVVEKRLNSYSDTQGNKYIILKNETLEANDYWVFFYNSSKYIETGDLSYALAGNAPLIVDKYQGEIYETGTANSIEFYIDQFERIKLPRIKVNVSK